MTGLKIKKALEDAGIGTEEAAVMLDVSKSTMYNLYKKDDVNVSLLQKVSQITGLPMKHWVSDDQSETSVENNNLVKKSKIDQRGDGYLNRYIATLEDRIREQEEENRHLREMNLALLGKSEVAPMAV